MDSGARILKGGAPPGGRRIAATVFDADRAVREMVAEAEERARRIRADAEAASARALAEAREAGRREGVAEAAATLARAAGARDRVLAGAPREVARLALLVARKILGEAVAEPAGLLALAESAVAACRGRREVVIRVSPGDGRTLRAGEGRLAAALGGAPVDVREDPAVAPGAVVIETEAGRVDAGIEAQLDALCRALEEVRP